VITEPVATPTGVAVPGDEYWPTVREICDKYGVLLIADEIITGFGRTGKMFGVEHWGVVPDIMTIAKGISSSYLLLRPASPPTPPQRHRSTASPSLGGRQSASREPASRPNVERANGLLQYEGHRNRGNGGRCRGVRSGGGGCRPTGLSAWLAREQSVGNRPRENSHTIPRSGSAKLWNSSITTAEPIVITA